MKRGLFSKMVATYTLIIAVSFVIIATVLSVWYQGFYLEQRTTQLLNNAEKIREVALEYLSGNISQEKMKENLSIMGDYLMADIWLEDNYGFVYAVSNDKYDSLIKKQIGTRNLEELRLGRTVEGEGTYEKFIKASAHTIEKPIFYNGMFKGGIIMNTSMQEIREGLKKVYEIIWFSAILAIIISGIVIYYFSEKIIIRPLAQINTVAGKIAQGEVNKRVYVQSEDEIGELAMSFNLMADSLEKVEKNRRDFISNVSHELRSPITSIKGFIGGILDGIIPKEKENYYLSITYEEIQRLTRLVNDLLDLSAMEAGQFSLRITEMDINEIIRLTVIKFETKVREKKIKVDVCFSEDSLFVAGDRDRLIQIITNLLDNAVKYVNEGGSIKISTRSKGTKAYISVFNNGPHITKAEIKNIWDRFYKSDKSRTSKMSTGLGLPIVRSILSQLGEDIWVESAEGEGVTFIFSLSKVK